MARNQPLAPRARVSAENPSGSFTVSWLSGASELAGGYYYVRIAPMVTAAGDPNQPFLPPNILIAEYTASAHVEASPGAHEYTFTISQSGLTLSTATTGSDKVTTITAGTGTVSFA